MRYYKLKPRSKRRYNIKSKISNLIVVCACYCDNYILTYSLDTFTVSGVLNRQFQQRI